jgi:hypothetical protein
MIQVFFAHQLKVYKLCQSVKFKQAEERKKEKAFKPPKP